MKDTVPTHAERMDAARKRQRAALDPQTDADRAAIEWLLSIGDHDVLPPLADMAERAAEGGRRAVATAYERGYHEAAQYTREHGGAP